MGARLALQVLTRRLRDSGRVGVEFAQHARLTTPSTDAEPGAARRSPRARSPMAHWGSSAFFSTANWASGFILAQPVLLALEARPRPAAAAVDLAALHRKIDVVAARIAGDEAHLAPNRFRMISAKVSGSAPVALPPSVNSRLNMSSQVLTGDVCQVAQMLVSLVTLPIHVSLVASNLASFSSGSVAMPRLTVASVRPSFAARP